MGAVIKARSYCTLNAHWFAFTLSRRECALSQSGLKPVWLNPLREVVLDWPLEVDWLCDCTHVACPLDIETRLYSTIYGMPSTRLARAYKNVFWLDDRGDKGPCRHVGAKLMSRASSME